MLCSLLLGVLFAIDPAKSAVHFSVEHIFVEHVTGSVPVVRGTIDIPSGSGVPAKIDAVLDATRIKTGDDDRDGVLQTADWFDTETYPTWTFTSTRIVDAPDGFGVDGLLTVHGVTQPEHLDVTISGDATHPAYHAVGRIDRHAFAMSKTRLDPVIGNPVDIVLDIRVKP